MRYPEGNTPGLNNTDATRSFIVIFFSQLLSAEGRQIVDATVTMKKPEHCRETCTNSVDLLTGTLSLSCYIIHVANDGYKSVMF